MRDMMQIHWNKSYRNIRYIKYSPVCANQFHFDPEMNLNIKHQQLFIKYSSELKYQTNIKTKLNSTEMMNVQCYWRKQQNKWYQLCWRQHSFKIWNIIGGMEKQNIYVISNFDVKKKTDEHKKYIFYTRKTALNLKRPM